jgi:hypothetical protein
MPEKNLQICPLTYRGVGTMPVVAWQQLFRRNAKPNFCGCPNVLVAAAKPTEQLEGAIAFFVHN